MADPAGEGLPETASGSEAARRYLEGLQESVYRTGMFGRPVLADLSASAREALEAKIYQLAVDSIKTENVAHGGELTQEQIDFARKHAHDSIYGKTPTRFEEPSEYGIVTAVAARVEKAVEVVTEPTAARPHPLIGTLPTGQVNAMAIRVPDTSEHIVVFESQIFNFCLLFSKAVTMAMPYIGNEGGYVKISTDMDQIAARLDQHEEITKRFFEVVAAYVVEGSPGLAPQYLPPYPWGSAASRYCTAMEFFIMAHEYSHVLLEHTGRGRRSASLLGGKSAEVLEWSRQQETDADALGAILLMASPDLDIDSSMRFVGVSLFFGALMVVESALTLLAFGEERQLVSETHPAHLERLLGALGVVLGLPGIDPDKQQGIRKLAEVIIGIVSRLWDRIRPVFYEMHQRGVRPHKRWNAGTPI